MDVEKKMPKNIINANWKVDAAAPKLQAVFSSHFLQMFHVADNKNQDV